MLLLICFIGSLNGRFENFKMKIALLITGDEILKGDLRDSNSYYLIQKFTDLGQRVSQVVILGDDPNALSAKIKCLAKNFDILMVNGGLGPTIDDYTSQALSGAMNSPLVENKEAKEQLNNILKEKGKKINQANLKQAYLPKKAKPILNRMGTAPGIYAELTECKIFCTPGVPKELFIMFEEQVMPALVSSLGEHKHFFSLAETMLLRSFGAGESWLQEILSQKFSLVGSSIKLGFRAHFPYVDIKLTIFSQKHKNNLQQKFQELQTLLQDYTVAFQEMSLGEKLVQILSTQNKKIVFAESCTGGLASSLITEVAGASQVFQAGYITYQTEEKSSCLGVSKKALAKGEVSQEVVTEMLLKALSKSKSDLGAAVSGIAGPGGGSAQNPVGTVWIAWGSSQKIQTKKFSVARPRKEFQILASHLVLDLLRRDCLKIAYLDSYSFETSLKK